MEAHTVKDAVQQMSVLMANLYYYLTREFVETYGDGAKDVIARAVIAFGHARGEAIAHSVLANGQPLTIENLDRYYDMPISSGWDLTRNYYSDHRDNITESCTFANVWKEKDWTEVGHLYCLVDIALREGYSNNIQFIPVKNILKGDKHCVSRTIYKDQYKESAEQGRDA